MALPKLSPDHDPDLLRQPDQPTAGPRSMPATAPRVNGSQGYILVKRALDILVSASVLIVTSPLLALCALLIKLESRGPWLYTAPRIGEGGRQFACFKLRTMRTGMADSTHRDAQRYFIEQSESVVAVPLFDDPRITRGGRWLRQSSLDELPQLLNVLRGDMSLVGPRPPLPYEVECYTPWQMGRLAVRPGLTGYWQVNGRGRVTFGERCRMDLHYIANRSLRLDLWILLKTPFAVLSRRGAG